MLVVDTSNPVATTPSILPNAKSWAYLSHAEGGVCRDKAIT